VLILVILVGWKLLNPSFDVNQTVEIKTGQSAQIIFDTLSWAHKMEVKWYIKNHNTDLSNIK
jgi:hypothetical protein